MKKSFIIFIAFLLGCSTAVNTVNQCGCSCDSNGCICKCLDGCDCPEESCDCHLCGEK